MAPQRKRENRENQFYDVGVQGRKTGITLADRGIYDEHGLEPISGIFSSPEKSPPKRGGTITASESMDMQESSIPELTSHQLLRNSRTLLPPPRSRSPRKTALGSSPRRQSSMAPRGSSVGPSSPIRAASHPTARRLDFEHDESSLQETPALSGSGQRRGKRTSVYDIPEDESSASAVLEESFMQQELRADEDSALFNGVGGESSIAAIGDDTTNGAEAVEDLVDLEPSEVNSEPVKEPAKRGRKRKSDTLEQPSEASTTKSRKLGSTSAQGAASHKRGKKAAPIPTASSQRPKRVSNITEQDSSILEASADASTELVDDSKTVSVQPKRRGRPPRSKPVEEAPMPPPAKPTKTTTAKASTTAGFKKPAKPAPKPKEQSVAKGRSNSKSTDLTPTGSNAEAMTFVDVHGHSVPQKVVDEMSTASVGSRYMRGRHLSVFREIAPDNLARTERTGRHRVKPIDFWKNDRIEYDPSGNVVSVKKLHETEPERRPTKAWSRGKKRTLAAVEEEEVELELWEEEGTLTANYRVYDPVRDVTTDDIVTDDIAWAQKGTQLDLVGDSSFYFKKLAGPKKFFNWGLIELTADQMKRTKNCRRMHMVFTLQSGTVEAKVNDNEFTVHKNGIWQVPRGNTYSIKNVGSGTARIFFAQACEVAPDEE